MLWVTNHISDDGVDQRRAQAPAGGSAVSRVGPRRGRQGSGLRDPDGDPIAVDRRRAVRHHVRNMRLLMNLVE